MPRILLEIALESYSYHPMGEHHLKKKFNATAAAATKTYATNVARGSGRFDPQELTLKSCLGIGRGIYMRIFIYKRLSAA